MVSELDEVQAVDGIVVVCSDKYANANKYKIILISIDSVGVS